MADLTTEDVLETARQKPAIAWHDLARLVRATLTDASWRTFYATRRSWLEAVATASGKTPGAIARYLAMLAYAEELTDRGLTGVLDAPFAGLELLKRLETVDAGRARELASDVVSGTIRISKLRAEYDAAAIRSAAPPNRAAGRRQGIQSHDVALARLESAIPGLLGANFASTRAVPELHTLRADLVAIQGRVDTVVGFEITLVADESTRSIYQGLIERSLAACTFFDQYYVVFASQSDRKQREFAKVLDWLEATNIGVLALSDKGESLSIVRAPQGPPTPDRTDKLRAALVARMLGSSGD